MKNLSKSSINKIIKMKNLQDKYKILYEEVSQELINLTDEDYFNLTLNDTIIDTTQYGTTLEDGLALLKAQIESFE